MSQSVARRDSFKQAAQARRLLANVKVAPYVIAATEPLVEYTGRAAVLCRSRIDQQMAGVNIYANQQFYLVGSTVAPERFYVVVAVSSTDLLTGKRTTTWQCSLADRNGGQKIIAKAKAYRAELVAAIRVQAHAEHVA